MTVKCPNCDNIGKVYLKAKDLNHKISDLSFDYFKCSECKLIFLHPIPDNLSAYYKTEYPPYAIPGSLEELTKAANHVGWRIDLVTQFVQHGRLLEIGPSYGAFLYAALRAGFEVDAIELDKDCCDSIKKTMPQVKVVNSSNVVQGISELNGRYDVITLWHNIEHLPDPWSVLSKCIDHLTENGVILIATPNPDSLQFRIFKSKWVHLDAPRHLSLIPQYTLTSYLSGKGMELLSCTCKDPDGLILNRMGWGWSLAYLLHVSLKNPFKRLMSKVMGILASPIESTTKYGAAYTAIYRKRL